MGRVGGGEGIYVLFHPGGSGVTPSDRFYVDDPNFHDAIQFSIFQCDHPGSAASRLILGRTSMIPRDQENLYEIRVFSVGFPPYSRSIKESL